MKTIKLNPHEHIFAVVPKHASGPGWSNQVVYVGIEDTATGITRWESLQPKEQTVAMQILFDIGASVAVALLAAVPTERVTESEG